MRVAALYDIHGNLPALEAVLVELRSSGATHVVVGGDVFPGPMAAEVLSILEDIELPVFYVRGNGDREVLACRETGQTAVPEPYAAGIRWNAEHLRPDHAARAAEWPETVRIEIPGVGPVLFCHATPRNDTEIFTRLTPEAGLLPVFADVAEQLVVCGHTHMQFDRRVGAHRIINAGSVGMPFGAPGAYWLMLGPDVELRATPFDAELAAARIRGTQYRGAADFAAKNVLAPPAEATMLAAFAAAEIRG